MNYSSSTVLLSSRLKIPVPRKNYIVRRALFKQLNLSKDKSIIYICGGAGTGKTTLLSSFIREQGLQKIGWLTLDRSNSSIYSFWLYFLSALSALCEDTKEILEALNHATEEAQIEEILIQVVNHLSSEEDYFIVLDDFHILCDKALLITIEYFINSMPSNLHLFLLSREEPSIYLGTAAVSGSLLMIDGNQMMLTPEEGISFLRNTLNLTLSEQEINQLNQYAEGWIGGLQLAAAAGMSGKTNGLLIRGEAGITSDYLSREMFYRLTEREQEFLVRTSFPSYFNSELCVELMEGMGEQDFLQTMELLIQKNLFILCIDEQNGVYRYHNILMEYLMQHFNKRPKEERKELHIKAAKVFEKQGDSIEALKEYCAAEEYNEILRVARGMEGRIEAWSYLNLIPIDILIVDADLAAQCLIFNLGNLNIERSRLIFEAFRTHYGDTDFDGIMKFAEFYITYEDGGLPQYQFMSEKQIQVLTIGPVAKAILLIENGIALMSHMRYEEAEASVKQAMRIGGGINAFVEYFAYSQLAQIYEEIGSLNESLSCYEKASKISIPPQMTRGMEANYYMGIVGVYMRRMELKQADKILEMALNIVEERQIHNQITDITIDFHIAEMKLLRGDRSAVIDFVEHVMDRYPKFSVLTISRLIYELDCLDSLSEELAEQFIKELDMEENYRLQLFMRLIRVRLLKRNKDLAEECREIDDILCISRLHKNKLRIVEAGLVKIYLLQEVALNLEQKREIRNLILEALHYAHKDQILMPFYLERKTVLPLLQDLVRKAEDMRALSEAEQRFLHKCITVCENQCTTDHRQDILSSRELEILQQLSLGITNREIAEKLFISQATVKTHLLSIFGKLGVGSRMMAVEAGRREGLVP